MINYDKYTLDQYWFKIIKNLPVIKNSKVQILYVLSHILWGFFINWFLLGILVSNSV